MESCIYCDKKGEKLTDEHIVPLGLGGDIVLPKCSCLECNKKTSRFENFILRGHWLGIRKKLQTGSRRKSQEPQKIKVKLATHKGEVIEGTVLSEDCNFQIIYDLFRPALFDLSVVIQDIPYARRMGMVELNIQGPSFLTTQSGNRVTIQPGWQIQYFIHEFTAEHFFRFFAKMAHGFVIKEKGENACSRYFLKKIILGETEEAMKYIGSAPIEMQGTRLPKLNRFHSLQIVEVDKYLTVLVQLFNMGSFEPQPIYQVVVGEKSIA